MKSGDIVQLVIFILALLICAPPLGIWMARVFKGQKTILTSIFGWVETVIYKVCSIDKDSEMSWKEYTKSLLVFNIIGVILLFLIQMFQKFLPLNPQNFDSLSWHFKF